MIDDKNICILLKCITTEIGKKKNALFSKYGITGFQSDILAFLYRNIDKDIYFKFFILATKIFKTVHLVIIT